MIIYLHSNAMQTEKTSQNSLAFYNEDKIITIDCNENFSSTGPIFFCPALPFLLSDLARMLIFKGTAVLD